MNSSLRPRYLLFLRVIWTWKRKENVREKFNCWHTCSHWNNLHQADIFKTFQKQQQQNTLLGLRPMRNYSLGVFILWENYKQLRIHQQQEAASSTFSQEDGLEHRRNQGTGDHISSLVTQGTAAVLERKGRLRGLKHKAHPLDILRPVTKTSEIELVI